MAQFSFNGTAKQLFVAKTQGAVTSAAPAGQIDAVAGETGSFHLQYKSPGGVLRSDIIKVANITKAKAVKGSTLARGLAKYEVALDANVNSGAPIAGQDYLLDFVIYEYGANSYEYQYVKHAAVRATSAMATDAAKFYVELLKSAELNFSREQVKFFNFSLVDAEAKVYTYDAVGKVWYEDGVESTEADVITEIPTKLIVEEVEQPWVKGLKQSDPVKFSILPRDVRDAGNDYTWGTVTKITSTTFVQNGKVTADMEYFYMGERGDVYRNVGFPYVINTEYLVTPSEAYHFIDISYKEVGTGVDVHEQNKMITIVVPGGTAGTTLTAANAIIADINTAAGSSILTALS